MSIKIWLPGPEIGRLLVEKMEWEEWRSQGRLFTINEYFSKKINSRIEELS